MKAIVLLACSLLLLCSAVAQHTYTAIFKNQEGEPLQKATVVIAGTYTGLTDSAGKVTISNLPAGKHTLVVTHTGFQEFSQTIALPQTKPDEWQLKEESEEEEEVTVTTTRSTRTIRDIPTRLEFIAGEELDEKANMKPGDIRMVLNESTGIQVQQTSATTANAAIRIQGLDGRYTQILKDGFPLYAGFSGGLGLLQTPPLDLKQVEVIKGSASTLYGGGAIAGLVNLVSKTPTIKGEATAFLNATSAGGLDVHAYYGKRQANTGISVFAARNSNRAYDPAGIDLTAIPQFERYTFNPRLYLWLGDKTTLQAGVNTVFENRRGGDLHYIKGRRDAGHEYFEQSQSQRMSTQLSLVRTLHNNCFVTVKNSFSFFNRTIGLPNYGFSARQVSSFSEASYTHRHEKTEWIYGITLFTDQLKEPEPQPLNRSFRQLTAGTFLQNSTRVHEKLNIETGLRADYVRDYGWLLLPRLSVLARWSPAFTSRIGGGLGYKTPSMFTEETERLQYRNLLPVNPQDNRLEKSYGMNADVNYRGRWGGLGVTINQLFFFTRLNNPLLLQLNSGTGFYSLRSSTGNISTRGAETNIKLSYEDFKLFLGYTYTYVQIRENDSRRENFLTPRHRVNAVLMYEVEEKWKAGLEAYYFDKQLLSDGKTGAAYWNCGFMVERLWEKFSVFINFENFLDARQTRNDVIFTGSRSNPQFRDIYAPLEGFVVNGGVKIRF
jgi:outer membrane receptor for ferrienterochelin and colicins